MKRVLLTGMSGTGKSTLISELAARGYKAVDADGDAWSEWVDLADNSDSFGTTDDEIGIWRNKDWVWREDRIQQLLSSDDADVLFVGGCAANQGKFSTQFDAIALLSAPTSVLIDRLARRPTNQYGNHPDERARILRHVQSVEPLLRRRASLEVDTSAPIDQVIEAILSLLQP